MAGSVLFLKLLCLLKVQEFLVTFVLKAATSPSCKTLADSLPEQKHKKQL
jgi:hypothetical protein